jgi:hypothetical protein
MSKNLEQHYNVYTRLPSRLLPLGFYSLLLVGTYNLIFNYSVKEDNTQAQVRVEPTTRPAPTSQPIAYLENSLQDLVQQNF